MQNLLTKKRNCVGALRHSKYLFKTKTNKTEKIWRPRYFCLHLCFFIKCEGRLWCVTVEVNIRAVHTDNVIVKWGLIFGWDEGCGYRDLPPTLRCLPTSARWEHCLCGYNNNSSCKCTLMKLNPPPPHPVGVRVCVCVHVSTAVHIPHGIFFRTQKRNPPQLCGRYM